MNLSVLLVPAAPLICALPPNIFVDPADQIEDSGQKPARGAFAVLVHCPVSRVLRPVAVSPIAIVGTMRVTEEFATLPIVVTVVAVSIKLILIAFPPQP
jgi:hypothetical protein